MRSSYMLSDLPRPVQGQLAGLGPLLLGAVVGFILGESAVGYWILSGLGIIGGVAGGFEHATLRGAAARGVVAGCLFGTGIVVAHAISDDRALAKIPSPAVLLIVFTVVGGTVLALIGFWLRGSARPPQ